MYEVLPTLILKGLSSIELTTEELQIADLRIEK